MLSLMARLAILLVAVALLVSGCSLGGLFESRPEVSIGAIYPLSGPQATWNKMLDFATGSDVELSLAMTMSGIAVP